MYKLIVGLKLLHKKTLEIIAYPTKTIHWMPFYTGEMRK